MAVIVVTRRAGRRGWKGGRQAGEGRKGREGARKQGKEAFDMTRLGKGDESIGQKEELNIG